MVKSASKLIVLYSLFAALSTLVNIGSQMLSMFIYSGIYAVPVSVLIGTLSGLPLRYVLEKRYIFSYTSESLSHDGRLFVLYGFMGVFTTLIFWSVEFVFNWMYSTDTMRYVGGVIGLSIGYYIKYQLDKRFVFVNQARVLGG